MVFIDAPSAPAYELCAQAGADITHEARGYVPRTNRGKIRDRVWAIGEVTGCPLDASRIEEAAEEISQLLYHLQVLMLALGLDLDDIYEYL